MFKKYTLCVVRTPLPLPKNVHKIALHWSCTIKKERGHKIYWSIESPIPTSISKALYFLFFPRLTHNRGEFLKFAFLFLSRRSSLFRNRIRLSDIKAKYVSLYTWKNYDRILLDKQRILMRWAKIRVHYSPPKAENTSYNFPEKKIWWRTFSLKWLIMRVNIVLPLKRKMAGKHVALIPENGYWCSRTML